MMLLTVEEKIEIVTLTRDYSYRNTAHIFNRRHPNRLPPLHFRTVYRICKQLQTRGSLQRKQRTASAHLVVAKNEITQDVLQLFRDDPHMSTRRAAALFGISHFSIWKMLRDKRFWPYKMAKKQKLHPDDPPKRKQFCQDLLRIFRLVPDFQQCILWTDEKSFPLNGCFNRQNYR